MQHVNSFTMFDSYHVALFTLQTRDFGKIQDGPQCVKWCIVSMNIAGNLQRTFYRMSAAYRRSVECETCGVWFMVKLMSMNVSSDL